MFLKNFKPEYMRLEYIKLFVIALILLIFPIHTFSNTKSHLQLKSSNFDNYINVNVDTIDVDTIDIDNNEFYFEKELVYDPIYSVNKMIFTLNDKIYLHFLKPLSIYYTSIIPLSIRTCIKNFFHNISMPTRFINCMLQCKWDSAQGEMARFIINSTFGIGGLLDHVNQYPELNPSKEDFGQTLGSYKIGNGFYIVWPILGPSTLRDSIGMIGDWFLNPINCIANNTDKKLAMFSLETLNDSSFKISQYEDFKELTFNPYEAFRNAYIQSRNNKVVK